jgi:hypothetical protein
MRQEVTYTEEVERTEEMLVCEDCQREVDEHGTTFVEKEAGATQEVHFCSECKPSDDSDEKPEHVIRAEEWFDGTDKMGFPVKDNITGARGVSAIIATLGLAVLAASMFGAEMAVVTLSMIITGLSAVTFKSLKDALGVVDDY